MKDQPQQPMAPMAFYPTWQADPSQGWQNQFIQQIPQNTPAITPLNSIEFQPQGYAAYQPNGYVQTAALGFDPNYGRTYAAPPAVQRYEFQTNQITPINQVSLQSVSFAPTVTYAGQVSSGPAVVLSSNSHHNSPSSHLTHNPHDQLNLNLNKQMSVSGNEMPGYPRVNSVPPRSLSCNGYPGQQEYGGQQQSNPTTNITTNTTTTNTNTNNTNINNNAQMHPPQQVPQSPNRNNMAGTMQQPPRPNSNQMYAQQSPNHYHHSNSNSLHQSPNNHANGNVYSQQQTGMHTPTPMQQQDNHTQHHQSPNHHLNAVQQHQQPQDWNWNQQHQPQQQQNDLFNQSDRVNLNSRIKTMILNKNDQKDVGLQQHSHMSHHQQQPHQQAQNQQQQQTGHFLSYSHHLRDTITPTISTQQTSAAHISNNSSSAMMGGGSSSSNSTEPIGDGGSMGSNMSIVDPNWKQTKSPAESREHDLLGEQAKHQVFEQKQQLIEKNNIDPGGGLNDSGGGGGGGVDKIPPPILPPQKPPAKTSKRNNKHENKNGKNNKNNHHHHHHDINQQIDSNKSSNNVNYSSSNFISDNNNSSSSSSSSSPNVTNITNPAYSNLNTYPAATNNNQQSSLVAFNSSSNEIPNSKMDSPSSLPIPTEAATKSPTNRFRHDNLNSGFNPHVPNQRDPHGAFHHPQPNNYNLSNVKKEPGVLDDAPPQKFDGYEKNYQNFIRYADYCDAQQGGAPQKPSQNPDYNNYYPPYNNYPGYQNYPNSFNQSYNGNNSSGATNQPPVPTPAPQVNNPETPTPLSSGSSTTSAQNIPQQTNFEQQIPLHTYPIPKNNLPQHQDIPIKLENEDNSYLGDDSTKDTSDSIVDSKDKVPLNQTPSEEEKKEETAIVKPSEQLPIIPKDEKPILSDKDKMEKTSKPEAPDCDCFPSDKNPPEPGSYYTHLGCASTLAELRRETENRVGLSGKQLRIEKVIYTGKEGKTNHGCPVSKWVIRRADPEEKLLFVVKRRQGHRCKAAFIVVCIVVWDGIPNQEADSVYRMLAIKLNKFGLPTVRRCATNENRTCACQGLDPETCGASYSFGCSWSMYYNGCKYARSKTVRKFRLSVKNEEAEIEERMNILATMLSPLYVTVAPQAFENQVHYEREAPDCRLGLKPGKPFSGVTCCLDFCAHTHRDLHNMQDGCTVQVTLLKPLPPGVPPDDEQLHILPLYIMDSTDEFDSEEGQKKKAETGAVQVLEKFPTEVRVRSTPLQPCRRHGKKRGNAKDNSSMNEELINEAPPPPPPPTKKESKARSKKAAAAAVAAAAVAAATTNINQNSQSSNSSSSPRAQTPNLSNQTGSNPNSAFSTPTHQNTINSPNSGNTNTSLLDMATMIDNFTDAQLQSNQISSTVLDSPYSYDYNTGQYVDNRQYYNQWPPEYYQNRGGDPNKMLGRSEEIPDTTTRPGSNSSNSAFSPSIPPDPTKTPTPVHIEDYNVGKLGAGTLGQPQVQPQLQSQQQQQQYHHLQQPEQGFVKPKPPDYNPGYGYHHPNNYPVYHPPYTPYDPYQNYNYGYPPQSYHPPYHNMYPSAQTQIPGTGPAPPPPPTAVIPAPPPPSNWNLYPPHPHHNSHMPPAPPAQLCPPQHQQHHQKQEHHQLHPPPQIQPPQAPPPPPKETLGEVTEVSDNVDCFQDTQMGGVSIALPHGSVIIECAKLEMHSTTSLKRPNRLNPTRMTLIFYQHRNLNRSKHGIAEWAEKMRLKKLGISSADLIDDKDMLLMQEDDIKAEPLDDMHHMRPHIHDDPDMMDVEYPGV